MLPVSEHLNHQRNSEDQTSQKTDTTPRARRITAHHSSSNMVIGIAFFHARLLARCRTQLRSQKMCCPSSRQNVRCSGIAKPKQSSDRLSIQEAARCSVSLVSPYHVMPTQHATGAPDPCGAPTQPISLRQHAALLSHKPYGRSPPTSIRYLHAARHFEMQSCLLVASELGLFSTQHFLFWTGP